MAICLGVAGVSTGLTYTLLAGHLASLCLGLAITGAMLAPTWPASAAALASWFPDNQRNSVFGLIATATFSGGLGGTALAAGLQDIYGWQYVGIPPAVLAVTTAAFVAFLLFSPEEKGITVPGKEKTVTTDSVKDNDESSDNNSILTICRIPCVLEVSAAMFCVKFVRYFMAMWLPLYLLEHLGYTKLEAGLFSTMFDIGGIVGTPVQGFLLDRYFGDHQLLAISVMMAIGTILTGLLLVTAKYGVIVNCICLLVLGAANCGPDSLLSGSVAISIGERAGRGRGGSVTSLINGVANMGGIVEGPVIGLLAYHVGWEGVLAAVTGVKVVGTLATLAALRAERRSLGDNNMIDS